MQIGRGYLKVYLALKTSQARKKTFFTSGKWGRGLSFSHRNYPDRNTIEFFFLQCLDKMAVS